MFSGTPTKTACTNFATRNQNDRIMNIENPPEGKNPIIFFLRRIVELLTELVLKKKEKPLLYRGREVIPIDKVCRGINISERTMRRYRKEEKIKYYVSIDGRFMFLLPEQVDDFFDENFRLSTDPEIDKHPSG